MPEGLDSDERRERSSKIAESSCTRKESSQPVDSQEVAPPPIAPESAGEISKPAGDALLHGFLTGDPRAVGEVRRLAFEVVRYRGYYIPWSDQEDVIQGVYVGLWREVLKPGFTVRKTFEAFVREVAHRRCIDWRRARHRAGHARGQPLEETDSPEGETRIADPQAERPDEALLVKEKLEIADRVVAALRKPLQELIHLRIERDLDYREIARLQGRSEDAVRKQWSECLKEATRVRLRLEESARSK